MTSGQPNNIYSNVQRIFQVLFVFLVIVNMPVRSLLLLYPHHTLLETCSFTLNDFRAYPIDAYPAKCKQAAAIMLMIMNNLDHKVAQFPHELVTYGGNGQVFSNWAQVSGCKM